MAQRPSDIRNTSGDEAISIHQDESLSTKADDAAEQTDDIKAQIKETRAEMGETIDAIQNRLSLSNISEQVSEQVNNAIETAKNTVYDATVGKAVTLMKDTGRIMKNTGRDISNSAIGETIKENPLPLALIGVGAGLLIYKGFAKGGNGPRTQRRRLNRVEGQTWDRDRFAYDRTEHERPGRAGSISDTAGSAAGSVSRAAGSAVDNVKHLAEKTRAGAADLSHRTIEKAEQLGTKAQETYHHYLEEKPWAIGALAVAAGAAIGMAIPSTRYEGRLMGEARMNLVNKVQESASELIDNAKQAASDAGQTLKDEAQNFADKSLS